MLPTTVSSAAATRARRRALFGLSYLDLTVDCVRAWRRTRRVRPLVAAVLGVLATVTLFAGSAGIVVALAVAWLGQPVRGWIAAVLLAAVVCNLTSLAAELVAPPDAPADGGADLARRIRVVLDEMAADVYLAADDPAHDDPAVPPVRAVAVVDIERALDAAESDPRPRSPRRRRVPVRAGR